MGTDQFLQFWHTNLNFIIGILIVTVFVLVGLFLFIEFIKEKNIATGQSTGDFKQIEDSIKKLLENTQVTAKPAPAAEGGASSEELEKLKALVDEKDEIIKKLEESGGGDAPAGGADAGLVEKVKDLEARLAEYEIIEDDIADLSMYKDENARLKDELEALKAQGPAPAAPAPAAEAPPPPPPEPAAEPAAEPGPEPEATAPEPAPAAEEPADEPLPDIPPAPAASEEDLLNDDIMAEFAAAVAEQKETEAIKPMESAEVAPEPAAEAAPPPPEPAPEPAAEAAPPPPPEPEPAPEPPPAEPAPEPAAAAPIDEISMEELLGESEPAAEAAPPAEEPAPEPAAEPAAEAAPAEEPAAEENPVAEGPIDTDKMLGEIDALNMSVADDDGDSVLAAEVDTDKMLGEAVDLNQSIEGGEQEKLAEEFDNFVEESS